MLCLVVLTTARDVFADAPLVGGLIEESGGPITTIQATPLEAGSFFADIMVEHVVFNRYTDTQLERFAREGKEVDSDDTDFSLSMGLSYGATENLSVGFRLPYLREDNVRVGFNEGGVVRLDDQGDSSGIGDMSLYGMYRFFTDEAKNVHVSGIFGVSVPTGRTSERTRQGGRFEVEHQPGSGS
ncbi:MAG: transporter [Planctomycetes bacterium]|nr:transporter [Planctomycetota bacterium]